MKKLKKKSNQALYSKIVMILLFLFGSLIMLYPFYIDALNNYLDQVRIERFQKKQQEEYKAQKQAMAEENKKITENGLNPGGDPFDEATIAEVSKEIYEEHLIGKINIPKLAVELPLFDVTTPGLLNIGATVLQGTSFPIGGESTHSVITGHRGLPEKELFTKLPNLEKGDVFLLTVLGKTLAYQVNAIEVVEPHETSSLQIVPGEDLVTLVTCTPYMINSHRLLVTGHRVPYTATVKKEMVKGNRNRHLKQVGILVGTLVIVTSSLSILVRIILRERLKKTRFDLSLLLQNEKGEPVSERVQLFDRTGKNPLLRDGQALVVSTDQNGRIHFAALPGGIYQLYFERRKQKVKVGIKKQKQTPKIYSTKFVKDKEQAELVIVLGTTD